MPQMRQSQGAPPCLVDDWDIFPPLDGPVRRGASFQLTNRDKARPRSFVGDCMFEKQLSRLDLRCELLPVRLRSAFGRLR
jgi:hypothetical protein